MAASGSGRRPFPALDAHPPELVDALARIDASSASSNDVERVLACLRHDNRVVRERAVVAIAHRLPANPKRLVALRFALRDEAPEVREQAIAALRSLDAVPPDWGEGSASRSPAWRPRAPRRPSRARASVRAVVRWDDELHDASEVMLDPGPYLAWLAAIPDVGCCDVGGGFVVDADGRPWFQPGFVDELSMADWWLPALAELLGGAEHVRIWSWEESGLVAWRVDDDVVLEDVHHSGDVICPRVTFELRAFGDVMLVAGETLAALQDRIAARLAGRYELDFDFHAGVAAVRAALEAGREDRS